MQVILSADIRPIRARLRREIFEAHDYKCAYCGKPATTIDHVIALSRGGHTERGNLVAACLQCNSSKSDRDLEDWKPDEWERCSDLHCQREHLAKVR